MNPLRIMSRLSSTTITEDTTSAMRAGWLRRSAKNASTIAEMHQMVHDHDGTPADGEQVGVRDRQVGLLRGAVELVEEAVARGAEDEREDQP